MADRSPSPAAHTARGPASYAERLWVPWWAWPPVIGVAALLAAEVHMGYPGVRSWLPYVLTVPLAVAILLWLGRVRVTVTDGVLSAGEQTLGAERIGRVDVVRGRAKQDALGPDLDPAAFVLHRPWVAAALRLEVLDPDGAGARPYWVISSRHPDRLVAAVRAGGATATPAGPDLRPRSPDR